MEAPPGFEPGMEVLQTSALPLGDGAGRNRLYEGGSGRGVMGGYNSERNSESFSSSGCGCSLHRSAFAPRRFGGTIFALTCRRKLERETGFEPATSTLARSHSTTELFPLTQKR